MSSVARDPGAFRSAPIFVESEEEIPAVIERLTRADAEEVPLVLPARSRFGQSRFNFQLLRDYSIRLGKRVAIIGLTVGLLQWLVAFLSVGGEWFLMWQSKNWNGQDAAFRMFTVVGIVLLFLAQQDMEEQA